ncbi:hypothetical protein EZ449_09950 [Pedobacter frigidisoli]|uniref:Uncharacterized protein n=1 Tax=Pedobacter frigidisoli TaxID=2530455 RepID=A0A4R0P4K5_9SPHI|nr:hypothetical protein [Pedobacter frigidisoli]TCD10140.1 hypothetical protein EZ449_09950 [Pedobacter frigidisoli]
MKTILNKPVLVLQLQKQLNDIKDLCGEYDLGNHQIINFIAEKVLIIFQNTDQTKSLLNQLKLTPVLMFCSSELYDPKSLTNFIGLLKLGRQPEKGWSYLAKLDNSSLTKVSQNNWWQNKKVIIDSDGVPFTRSKIIKSFADDISLNLNTSGWKLKDADRNKLTINPIPETVRQIAFELLESFKNIDLNKESKLHLKV